MAVGLIVIFTISQTFGPGTLNTPDPNQSVENPLGIPSAELIINIAAGIGLFAGALGVIVGAAVMQIRRFRRADGDLRQQLKWFGAAAIFNAVVLASAPVFWNVGGGWGTVWGGLYLIALTALPLATGVAILRYRLYEIDVIIRKTLVYTALAATLAVVYLGGISLTTWALRWVTGQSGALAVTLSTLAVAAVFQPLRTRIQRAVDRHFYRRRYDTVETLEAFSSRLRQQIDLHALETEVLGVATEALQPSHATLWLRRTGPEAEPSRASSP